MLAALRTSYPLIASTHDILVDNPFAFLLLALGLLKVDQRFAIASAVVCVALLLLGLVEDIRASYLLGLDDPHMHIGRR